MPPSPVEELIEAALGGVTDEGWSDDHADSEPVAALQRRADPATLAAAVALTRDDDARRRRLGAAILAQLGHVGVGYTPVFVEERFAALRELLENECAGAHRSSVIESVCVAFGHLDDMRGAALAASFAAHPSGEVRYAVAFALQSHDDDRSVGALIALSGDVEAKVRDWATFALARQTSLDTPALRAALAARLADEDDETREEAVAGLAMRKDAAARAALERDLPRRAASLLYEAAAALRDPSLLPALRASKARADGLAQMQEAWREAVRACGGTP